MATSTASSVSGAGQGFGLTGAPNHLDSIKRGQGRSGRFPVDNEGVGCLTHRKLKLQICRGKVFLIVDIEVVSCCITCTCRDGILLSVWQWSNLEGSWSAIYMFQRWLWDCGRTQGQSSQHGPMLCHIPCIGEKYIWCSWEVSCPRNPHISMAGSGRLGLSSGRAPQPPSHRVAILCADAGGEWVSFKLRVWCWIQKTFQKWMVQNYASIDPR